MLRLKTEDVLTYTETKRSSETIKRHFRKYRVSHQIPAERCDCKNCYFYDHPLEWNGKPLSMILDHKDGVNSNNRPENLRFLCPNCDSQLPTKGGGNKGKIEKSAGGFSTYDKKTELTHSTLIADTGGYKLGREDPIIHTAVIVPAGDDDEKPGRSGFKFGKK